MSAKEFVNNRMKPIEQWNSSLLIFGVALVAIFWVPVAYLIADTGFPGGISVRDENLIYAVMAFILGFAGWAVVWRREVFVRDLGRRIQGKWAAFWGFVTVALFWGAALWFADKAL